MLALVQALRAGVPVPRWQRLGVSETLDSPQLMEPVVFNLFSPPLLWYVCWGEGKGFTFVLHVSQVNKVILGSLPCLQVLGRAWVLYVAGKKQLFVIPWLP